MGRPSAAFAAQSLDYVRRQGPVTELRDGKHFCFSQSGTAEPAGRRRDACLVFGFCHRASEARDRWHGSSDRFHLRLAASMVACSALVAMPFLVGAPQPLRARQGREQQRYGVEGDRLVAG